MSDRRFLHLLRPNTINTHLQNASHTPGICDFLLVALLINLRKSLCLGIPLLGASLADLDCCQILLLR